MIVGNQHTQTLLQSFIDRIHTSWQISNGFLLLVGPSHVGKTTLALEAAQQLVEKANQSDLLIVSDLSDRWMELKELNKDTLKNTYHELKIEIKDGDKERITLDRKTGERYRNVGIREINERLSKSSIGQYKVAVITNIERMNVASANAFLKTLEEPLPDRLIICTTSNVYDVPETILSRACILRFETVDDSTMQQIILWQPGQNNPSLEDILDYAGGRPGLVPALCTPQHDGLSLYHDIISTTDWITRYHLLAQAVKLWCIREIIDAMMLRYMKIWQYQYVDHLLSYIALSENNISLDHLVFRLSLQLWWYLQKSQIRKSDSIEI